MTATRMCMSFRPPAAYPDAPAATGPPVAGSGGLPEKLPVPYGEFGSISPDGRRLAFTTISVDFRTWKRYRGGMNPDIWLFDLETRSAKNVTRNDANDAQPMWHGDSLYFLS